MRLFSALLLFMFFIACNNSAKKKDHSTDTAKQVKQLPATSNIPDTVFHGIGTEPFWSVYVIKDSKIVFDPADGPEVELPYVAATIVDPLTTTYNSTSGTSALNLTIIKKNCSDGMSETVHPYEVTLTVNGSTYSGCGKQ